MEKASDAPKTPEDRPRLESPDKLPQTESDTSRAARRQMLSPQALQLMKLFEDSEFYLVGGAVRDILLGRTPNDEDFTTKLRAPEIEAKLADFKTFKEGKQFGTIAVLIDGKKLEITSYRRDGKYLDGRHPEQVEFSDSLIEDLSRRDFTINAMAMDSSGKIYDYFGGQEDLQAGIIRTVGTAEERFSEDYLRILRAFRFRAKLGFTFTEEIRGAVAKLGFCLEKISLERQASELLEIIKYQPELIEELLEYGLLDFLWPEFQAATDRLAAVGKLPSLYLKITGLLSQLDEQTAKLYLRRLFLEKELRQQIARLLVNINYQSYSDEELKNAVINSDLAYWEDLFLLAELGLLGAPDAEKIFAVKQQVQAYLARAHSLKELAISGRDLQLMGIESAKIGQILTAALVAVMSGNLENERVELLEYIRRDFSQPAT
ncbi:MAG: hypothetical protein Q4P65_04425 [Eubacteriales bacterium]|nr:hypothetical protein [Eubacteriales bacterium]